MDINSRIATARQRFLDADPLNVEEYDAAQAELKRLKKERNDMLAADVGIDRYAAPVYNTRGQ